MVAKIECTHDETEVTSKMTRLDDRVPPRFMLDVSVTCKRCRGTFRFVGLPVGVSIARATMMPARTEASFPMEPPE